MESRVVSRCDQEEVEEDVEMVEEEEERLLCGDETVAGVADTAKVPDAQESDKHSSLEARTPDDSSRRRTLMTSDGGVRDFSSAQRRSVKTAVKCPRAKDIEELFAVRKRLFQDGLERPTPNVFYIEGERIDMTDFRSCATQLWFFARIFNSLLYFSKCKFAEKSTVNRDLTWEAKFTEIRLERLQANRYKDFHITIPSAVWFVLKSLEGIQTVRNDEMIFQLVPTTCTIDKTVKERLKVNSVDLRQVNNSTSLSVNLSVDMKFMYAGQFRTKNIPDKGEKHYVAPTLCMGNYLNAVVSELYDLIYDRTVEYIGRFFERHPEDPMATPSVDAFLGDTDPRGAKNKMELKNRATLKYLLRSVGREINLKKTDLNKNDVFLLTSSLKTKNIKYLNAKKDLSCSIEFKPDIETEAVFLSSFVRARIMEDGTLNFQIYSRTCMYMSDDEEFPGLQEEVN